VWIVKGCELDTGADDLYDIVRNENRIGEFLSGVNESVPDGIDLRRIGDDPVLRMKKSRERESDRGVVIRDLQDFLDLTLPLGQAGEEGVARTDVFDVALGKSPLADRIHQLEFHGRAAAVQYQYVHDLPLASKRMTLTTLPW